MPKKDKDDVKTVEYNDKSLKEARLRGRNDLMPTNVHIPGPYGKGNANVLGGVGEARGPGGDDTNTPSPGAAGGTAAGATGTSATGRTG